MQKQTVQSTQNIQTSKQNQVTQKPPQQVAVKQKSGSSGSSDSDEKTKVEVVQKSPGVLQKEKFAQTQNQTDKQTQAPVVNLDNSVKDAKKGIVETKQVADGTVQNNANNLTAVGGQGGKNNEKQESSSSSEEDQKGGKDLKIVVRARKAHGNEKEKDSKEEGKTGDENNKNAEERNNDKGKKDDKGSSVVKVFVGVVLIAASMAL